MRLEQQSENSWRYTHYQQEQTQHCADQPIGVDTVEQKARDVYSICRLSCSIGQRDCDFDLTLGAVRIRPRRVEVNGVFLLQLCRDQLVKSFELIAGGRKVESSARLICHSLQPRLIGIAPQADRVDDDIQTLRLVDRLVERVLAASAKQLQHQIFAVVQPIRHCNEGNLAVALARFEFERAVVNGVVKCSAAAHIDLGNRLGQRVVIAREILERRGIVVKHGDERLVLSAHGIDECGGGGLRVGEFADRLTHAAAVIDQQADVNRFLARVDGDNFRVASVFSQLERFFGQRFQWAPIGIGHADKGAHAREIAGIEPRDLDDRASLRGDRTYLSKNKQND